MSLDVRGLAEQRSKETGVATDDWLQAIESARATSKLLTADTATLERLVRASSTPQKFSLLMRLSYQHGKRDPVGPSVISALFSKVDHSQFSLADWVDAVDYFYRWLQERARPTHFASMLDYLECCSAAPDAKEASPTLVALVQEMLDIHGYEGR